MTAFVIVKNGNVDDGDTGDDNGDNDLAFDHLFITDGDNGW